MARLAETVIEQIKKEITLVRLAVKIQDTHEFKLTVL